MRQAGSNLLSPLIKHMQHVLGFHCIRTNRINSLINQCSEIVSAFSNGLHTFGRDADVTSRAICITLAYFTLHATGPVTSYQVMNINQLLSARQCSTHATVKEIWTASTTTRQMYVCCMQCSNKLAQHRRICYTKREQATVNLLASLFTALLFYQTIVNGNSILLESLL